MLAGIRQSYLDADWLGKGKVLDGFVAATHYERKYACRLLNGAELRKSAQDVIDGLRVANDLLPFGLQGLDTDCVSKFINFDVLVYCEDNHITFTISILIAFTFCRFMLAPEAV